MGHAALGLANPAPQACLNFVPSRPRAWQLSGRRGWPAAPQVKFNAAQAVCSPAPPLPLVPCVQMRPHPAAPREPLGRVERGGPSSLLALAPRAQACSRQRPGPAGAGPAVPQALSRYRQGPAAGEKPWACRVRFCIQGQGQGAPARRSAGHTLGAQAACGEGVRGCEPKVTPVSGAAPSSQAVTVSPHLLGCPQPWACPGRRWRTPGHRRQAWPLRSGWSQGSPSGKASRRAL